MKKFRKFIQSPAATVAAFVLAAGLLLFSSVGGARAALTYFSETYATRVQLFDIGEDGKLILGKPYTEELSIRNSGTINHYARVTVYKYWVDENGAKRQDLDPGYIDLHLVNIGTDWLEDESARTVERTVLYYSHLLNSTEVSALFADKLTINGEVAYVTSQTTAADGSTVTVYDYDGAQFIIEAKVDAVQENNAAAAALSAWGEQVTIDEDAGVLSLN